jgi:hypothetical protein
MGALGRARLTDTL